MGSHTILFDLDGTLLNSHDGIINGMQFVLAKLKQPVPQAADLSWCIGPPLEDNFRFLLGGDKVPDTKVRQATELYHEYYAETGIFQANLYSGIAELIETLHQHNHQLYVATSKLEQHAYAVLTHFGLQSFFHNIHGASRDGRVRKKVDVIHQAVVQNQLDAQQCIMIGDHEVDILGGKQHGMFTIGVTYGYGSNEEIIHAQPDKICTNSVELKTLLLS